MEKDKAQYLRNIINMIDDFLGKIEQYTDSYGLLNSDGRKAFIRIYRHIVRFNPSFKPWLRKPMKSWESILIIQTLIRAKTALEECMRHGS